MVRLTRSLSRRHRMCAAAAAVAVLASVLTACGSGSGSVTSSSSSDAGKPMPTGPQRSGGSMTVLNAVPFGTEMASLDPGNVGGNLIYSGYLGAIFGQLFWVGQDGKIVPGLASGYSFDNNGKKLTIKLRKGVTFSDGTAFNAEAVVWNFRRDAKEGKAGCNCVPTFLYEESTKISAPDPHTVVVEVAQPMAVGVLEFSHTMWNYIASPSAFKKMGAKAFRNKPVGAGPFIVKSFSPNDKLVLKRNPTYWKKGHPYLDKLTFKSVQDAQSALQAMKAGQGDVFQNLSLYQLVDSFRENFKLLTNEPSTPYDLQLNTLKPPFDSKKAREVMYYATNVKLLNEKLFDGTNVITQSFAPAGTRFPIPKVPGYRTYDLDKAKALVKELGGLDVTLSYLTGDSDNTAKALQTMWQQAGVNVELDPQDNARYLQSLKSKDYQVYLNLMGGYDPAAGSVPAYLLSTRVYSAVHDKHLDKMITKSSSTIDQDKRAEIYKKIAKYISDQAYVPFLFGQTRYTPSVKSAQGPGISTPLPSTGVVPLIWWQDVSIR